MSNLPLDWVKNLTTEDERKAFEDLLRNSTRVLTRLQQLLDERENAVYISEMSIRDFDSPAWAQKQAFRNGQRSSLRDIKSLLNFIGPK